MSAAPDTTAITGPDGLKEDKAERYISIIQDLQRFRGSGMAGDVYDFPNHTFFKILFHFYNNSDATTGAPGALGADAVDQSSDTGTGLLHPTWLLFKGIKEAQDDLETLWNYNSAWAYLVANNEIQRAANLRSAVEILSNINSNTPWYFQSVKGLDTATQRATTGEGFNIKAENNKITIECLPDAYDQRIGTFLDLYRSVAWSWETKREILPANLRKFDMTIIAFQMPIAGLNIPRDSKKPTDASMRNDVKIVETADGFAVVYDQKGMGSSIKLASYKAWELHGCEFNYNTTPGGLDSLSNVEGTSLQPNLEIFFDDCFEIRFNEFLGRHVSDLMGDNEPMKTGADFAVTPIYTGRDETGAVQELPAVAATNLPKYTEPNVLTTEQLIAQQEAKNDKLKARNIYLGNLMGLSLASGLIGGVLDATGVSGAINKVTTNLRSRVLGNIFRNRYLTTRDVTRTIFNR